MSIQLSANSFLQMLSQSRLLSDAQIRSVEQRFPPSAMTSSPKAICEWLLAESIITEWHAEKLLQSKFRGFFLGPYKLLNRVARGGMSTIYSARHELTGELHALKVLPPARTTTANYLLRFQREASITQRLQHPHIVRVFGIYSESDGLDAIHFMAMELMQGRDLFETVNSDGPLACRQAAEFIRQVATGLQHAHEEGLVHRDIKPANLFLGTDGCIRILDLGLAQDFDSEENLTREFNERVLGTADYLSPEQAADSHTVDRRADIYSLGCTLYFLLTGHPPFTEGTLVQRLVAHQTKTPPLITEFRNDVPDELIAILNGMMEKNRNRRIATAADVAERLSSFLASTLGDLWLNQPPSAITGTKPHLEMGAASQTERPLIEQASLSAADVKAPAGESWPRDSLWEAADRLFPSETAPEIPVVDQVAGATLNLSALSQPSLFGLDELLRSIQTQCHPDGMFSLDPRREKLLVFAQELLAHPDDDTTAASTALVSKEWFFTEGTTEELSTVRQITPAVSDEPLTPEGTTFIHSANFVHLVLLLCFIFGTIAIIAANIDWFRL